MKETIKVLILLTLFVTAFFISDKFKITPIHAENSPLEQAGNSVDEEILDLCNQYAQEEKISAFEIDNYMDECVEETKADMGSEKEYKNPLLEEIPTIPSIYRI